MSAFLLRYAVSPPASGVSQVGSLAFSGGASTANSPTVFIPRTGAMDLNAGTIEFWVAPSANPADNNRVIATGANYNVVDCNIIWDSDSVGESQGFIIGLSAGIVVFGIVTPGAQQRTIGGLTDIRNGALHHVYVYRSGSLMEIGVDGTREASFNTAPTGLITAAGGGTNLYHALCKEKLNATFGCNARMSLIRVSANFQRYPGATYTVPTAPFAPDGNTTGLYDMTEQGGLIMGDSSGNGFDGDLQGSPVPTWINSGPF